MSLIRLWCLIFSSVWLHDRWCSPECQLVKQFHERFRFHDISLLLRLQCCHKKISWWVYARPGVMAYCLQKPVSPSIVFPLTQWRKSIGSFCCECGSHNPSWWQVSITTLKYELVNTEKSLLHRYHSCKTFLLLFLV